MSRDDYDDALYRECINIRITPAPGTGRGPTACWLASQVDEKEDGDATIHHLPIVAAS